MMVLILGLCGCGSGSAGNTIQPWQPADEQAKAALEIVIGNGYSAFAGFDADETYQNVKMGIEYYQDGKLKEDGNQGTFQLQDSEEGAKAVQGIAGLSVNDGKAKMGVSAEGNSATVSDVELPGFSEKKDGDLIFAASGEPRNITDGEKIYLAVLNSGSDELGTDVLTDPGSRGKLAGKSWFFYVVFSTEPAES